MIKELSKRRFKKYLNVRLATNPGRVVLNLIVVFNIILFFVASLILKSFNIEGSEDMNFLEAAFYVMRLIIANDVGYKISKGAVGVGVFTIIVMLLGIIFFTGSLIAYMTNYIATYMSYRSPATKKLYLYNHIVLLGWNVRATEIIRNLLFIGKRQDIVVLANEDRDKIKDAIDECIEDAIYARNTKLRAKCKKLPFFARYIAYYQKKLRNKLTIIIKTGDTYSSQQLLNVSLNLADAVIVLGENINNYIPENNDGAEYAELYGNSQIIKTVAQVVHITSSEKSLNKQNIIVEVDDPVTLDLVSKIIKDEHASNKCRIIPMPVTYTMGSLISQFALNPEMGPIYNELLSQYGLTIAVTKTDAKDDIEFTRNYLKTHNTSLPLSMTTIADEGFGFCIEEAREEEVKVDCPYNPVKLNITDCVKTVFNDVVFFGHNSQFKQVLKSIDGAVGMKHGRNRLLLIDSKRAIPDNFTLKNCDVEELFTSVANPEGVYEKIWEYLSSAKEDITFVILSSNEVSVSHADDETIATLVRVRELQLRLQREHPEFDLDRIKIVVEILDPKHHDIIKSFNVHNVIISNRLTSKMITQFAFEGSLFNLYLDMLVKDPQAGAASQTDLNNDMYTLRVDECFKEMPPKMSAHDLISSMFESSIKNGRYVILLGLIDKDGKVTLFDKDQDQIVDNLEKDTQLILYHL